MVKLRCPPRPTPSTLSTVSEEAVSESRQGDSHYSPQFLRVVVPFPFPPYLSYRFLHSPARLQTAYPSCKQHVAATKRINIRLYVRLE